MTKRQLINYWKKGFDESGLLPELVENYTVYISQLIENEVPIIFDFNHLCLLLGRKPFYLASVINSTKDHYRDFSIPKRSGGHRTISSPYPALLECQYWIYENILKKIKIHSSAHGFTFKKSILTNAAIHLNQDHFLKIDLKDFFPSIKINRVISIFKSLGYNHKVSFYLASICCLNDELPQGAPTSPVISNIIAINLDNRLLRLSKKFQLKYSRYADDLAFSGSVIPVKYIEYVSKIVEGCGFVVNSKKTSLLQSKGRRILTGISITGEKMKLPKDYKRNLKQEIFYIKKYGILSHMRSKKIKNPAYFQSIIGKVRFWLSVEPDNEYAKRVLKEYIGKPIE